MKEFKVARLTVEEMEQLKRLETKLNKTIVAYEPQKSQEKKPVN